MGRNVTPLEIVERKSRSGKSYLSYQNKRKRSPTASIKRNPSPQISPSKEESVILDSTFNDQWLNDMEPSVSNKKAKTSGRV